MTGSQRDQQEEQEFAAFLRAEPATPARATEKAIFRRVKKSLCPSLAAVLAKLIGVNLTAGLVTLTLCPQFGIGFGAHHLRLHAWHEAAGPFLYNLSCGLFFVVFGAALSGVALRQEELRVLGKIRYAYLVGYAVLAFSAFSALGAEVVFIGALAWLGGAALGNLFGFELGTRLRTVLN
ncbi:MAG: hypothetical protein IH614_18135 [Desulfuromonadales bacterium]|nr:hypothetical protein [Desulfuromonadales bacterium]